LLLGNLAAQAIFAGTGLVVIDSKRDEFMPHILAEACDRAGRTIRQPKLAFLLQSIKPGIAPLG
jgi:hypothetical protein